MGSGVEMRPTARELPVAVITAIGNVEVAVAALKLGVRFRRQAGRALCPLRGLVLRALSCGCEVSDAASRRASLLPARSRRWSSCAR